MQGAENNGKESHNVTNPLSPEGNGRLRCYNMMWRNYNSLEGMSSDLQRIADLGVNSIWLQPIVDVGSVPKSDMKHYNSEDKLLPPRNVDSLKVASLYASRFPFMINPEIAVTGYDPQTGVHYRDKKNATPISAEEAFKIDKKAVLDFTTSARQRGLTPMFDIAFSHMSLDSPLVKGEDPYFKAQGIDTSRWFKKYIGGRMDGKPEMHGVDHNGKISEFWEEDHAKAGKPKEPMIWEDIALFNYQDDKIRNEIIKHLWKPYIDAYVEMGFTGLRIDSVAQNQRPVLQEVLDYFKEQVHEKWGVPKEEVGILGETLTSDLEVSKFQKYPFNWIYNSMYWTPINSGPKIDTSGVGCRDMWEHHGRGNEEADKKNWPSHQMGILQQVVFFNQDGTEKENAKGGSVGYPGSVDERAWATFFCKPGVTCDVNVYRDPGVEEVTFVDLRHNRVWVKPGQYPKDLNQENIREYFDIPALEKSMREKMAHTMLLSDGGYFLFGGDEFLSADHRSVFKDNVRGYRLGDVSDLVKDINQMIAQLPATKYKSWSTRKFLDSKPDLVVIEKHNGEGFKGRGDVMIVNSNPSEEVTLTRKDIEALSQLMHVQDISANEYIVRHGGIDKCPQHVKELYHQGRGDEIVSNPLTVEDFIRAIQNPDSKDNIVHLDRRTKLSKELLKDVPTATVDHVASAEPVHQQARRK